MTGSGVWLSKPCSATFLPRTRERSLRIASSASRESDDATDLGFVDAESAVLGISWRSGSVTRTSMMKISTDIEDKDEETTRAKAAYQFHVPPHYRC